MLYYGTMEDAARQEGHDENDSNPSVDEPVYYNSNGRLPPSKDLEEASEEEENKRLEKEVYYFSDRIEAPPSDMSKKIEIGGEVSKIVDKMDYHAVSSICYKCKSKINDDANFCPYCGHSIKSAASIPTETEYTSEVSNHNNTDKRVEEFRSETINSTSSQQQKFTLRKKLETYRDKLLRLEQRNHSILLRRIYDKSSFDLVKLIARGNRTVETVIEKALQKKSSICLINDNDETEDADKDRTRIRSLYRNLTQIELETGLHESYLGFPFLAGHIGIDTYVRAPLILFPISIEYQKLGRPPGWYLVFSKEKPTIVNRALLALLSKKGRINTSELFFEQFEELLERIENLKSNDLNARQKSQGHQQNRNGYAGDNEYYFIQELSKLLLANEFPLKLIEDDFSKVVTLEPLSREEQTNMQREQLHLVNYKVIGRFPQGDSAIYSDYEELMKRAESGETNQGIIDNLLDVPSTEDTWNGRKEGQNIEETDLDTITAQKLNLVLESDASQEAAIVAAQSDECVVVRGPPGTGKSQAIVNLISNALAEKKRVLLVCQKRVALDVVYQRLNKVGLSKYVSLLHDPIYDRKTLYNNLSTLLNSNPPNYIRNQESVEQQYRLSKKIDDLIAEQRSINEALSKKYFGGISIRELYAQAQSGYTPRLDPTGVLDKIRYDEINEIIDTVAKLEYSTKKFDSQSHIWVNRKNFAEVNSADKSTMIKIIDDIISKAKVDSLIVMSNTLQQQQLIASLEKLISTTGMFRKLKGSVKDNNEIVRSLVNDPKFLSGNSSLLESILSASKFGLKFLESLKNLTNFMNDTGFNLAISESSDVELTKLLNLIDDIISKAKVDSLIVMSNTLQQQQLIASLEKLISTTGMFRKLKGSVKDNNEIVRSLVNDPKFISQEFTILDLPWADSRVEQVIHRARCGLDLLQSLENMKQFMNDKGLTQWKSDFSDTAIQNQEFVQKLEDLKKSLVDEYESILEYDKRKKLLTDVQFTILEQCKEKLIEQGNWNKILQQEFYVNWIQIIEKENPVLKNLPFERYIENCKLLTNALERHRALTVKDISDRISSEIVSPKIIAGRRLSKDRDSYLRSWRSLAADLDKKRRVLPVRALIKKYENFVFTMTPCWLASPEAVSSVFPLYRNLFDYVIFDEASQCAVERSLTSLYRGGHIIIMGDEKQLTPFDLFRIGDEEGEEYSEEIDESMVSESLLVLAKRTYGYHHLVWHYRSKHQELIDYSNHAFYGGHLQVAPNAFHTTKIPIIQWIHCETGLWDDRQNIPEAKLVIEAVKKQLLQNRNESIFRSIGIITFNEKQKTAILDQIELKRKLDPEFDTLFSEAQNPPSKNIDDIPFVKNIENVQGDERDIIIFSVAYAKDKDGILKTQFGTLSQSGGENRLNVAITRARQKIVVISSIEPEELKIEHAKNEGPKKLREYLEYAKFVSEGRVEEVERILSNQNKEVYDYSDDTMDSTAGVFGYKFEDIIADALRNLGYNVKTKVGYSGYKIDIAVVHPDDPDRYILGIECDGPMFQSARSTRERDVMRHEFLKSRGWTMERVWSINWWKNPDIEVERIRQRIEELRIKSKI